MEKDNKKIKQLEKKIAALTKENDKLKSDNASLKDLADTAEQVALKSNLKFMKLESESRRSDAFLETILLIPAIGFAVSMFRLFNDLL